MLTPIFRKLGLKSGNQLQFKCDVEQNTFWNLTFVSEANLWKGVVQYSTENQKSLSDFCQKMKMKYSSIEMIKWIIKLYFQQFLNNFWRLTFILHVSVLLCTAVQRVAVQAGGLNWTVPKFYSSKLINAQQRLDF